MWIQRHVVSLWHFDAPRFSGYHERVTFLLTQKQLKNLHDQKRNHKIMVSWGHERAVSTNSHGRSANGWPPVAEAEPQAAIVQALLMWRIKAIGRRMWGTGKVTSRLWSELSLSPDPTHSTSPCWESESEILRLPAGDLTTEGSSKAKEWTREEQHNYPNLEAGICI